ncbi:hypothetical protein PVAP13_2NG060546 [Panicum virgatum]|uniref:Uncharacterized protein n=1 Tax=Panicum virgatum TaxID=38727 RepID=A0A8T0V6N9_PANVG|nr:hypothetical protein PVAP13_2NG060546 [Panicum virgatum]
MPSPQFRLVDFYGCLVGSQRGRAKCHRGITASPPSPSAVVREASIHHRRLPPPSGSTDGGGGEPRPACCGRWRSCRPRGREHPGPRRRSRPPRLHLRGVETNRAGRRATSSSPSTISRLHHLSHEQPGVCLETIGEKNFNELKSRSFFQDLKSVPFDKHVFWSKHHYCSRITCKIHDLMHDVAESAMGTDCAVIATQPSEIEDALHLARHLYLSVDQPEILLNASLEKGSPVFQTLICDGHVFQDMKILSKYNSIRALKINRGSFLRPKYLHHLRYLDLSESDIRALPEDISILYHLQTLDLFDCGDLQRLPKELKYLTSLRHLYSHKCPKLKSMPAELGHLTSLQTLTCFVVGTDSDCSNVGELQNLDLGGKLELRQLENVTGANVAQAASLANKKKLTELELVWTDSDQEALNNNHEEVVEGLKPHDGLKVLRIYSCGRSTLPTWINILNGMMELKLSGCKKLEKLPALWQLPVLEILHLVELESLHCLCSSATTPVTFQ